MITVDLKSLLGRLDRFLERALNTAAGLSVSQRHYEVTVEQLFFCIIEEPKSDIAEVLRHFEVDRARFAKALRAVLEDLRAGNAGRPVFSPLLLDLFQESWVLASIDHHLAEVRSGILLRALLAQPSRFSSIDFSFLLEKVKLDELKTRYAEIVASSTEGPAKHEESAPRGGGAPAAAGDGGALSKYALDFTERASKGEVDPVFGRDREIRQIVDILARRRKNNPICVGEAGVGKTAVIEGLAVRITEGDVPDVLKNVRILSLDLGLLQAGAGMKGEFESRLKSVLDEVKSSPKPIVIFIDEAHTLIGSGGPAGGGDAANLLKPALARGELRTIAATTWSEYKKYFEKDAALARRFQVVKLDEPSDDVVTTMLRGLKDRYESAHKVWIQDDALTAAARLGSRYISGRQHPDKGVDLMDTAAARVKIGLTTKPDTLQDVERRIQTLDRELRAHRRDSKAGGQEKTERIAEIEEEIRNAKEEETALAARWQKEKAAVEKVVELRGQIEAAAGNGTGGAKDSKPLEKDSRQSPKDSKQPEKDSKQPAKDSKQLEKDLAEAIDFLRKFQGKDPLMFAEVGPETIARVVSDWTGIPVGRMVRDEAEAILKFEASLKKRIRGQDHALEIVGRGVRAAKAGLKNPSQPMGVFLFVGPSGVGKTECALGVADLLFGGERFMTTINMSEFQEKHTVSRLIGSPPGYVGYGEGGVLTEAVRQRPYSVVLLDEVEKADPEVMNLFYQVFDKGMLSDGEGRVIDFKDTVIFLTSNLASDITTEFCARGAKPVIEGLTAAIRPVLSKHFKPALLARMTIVPFYPIDADAMKEIVKLKLGHLAARLMDSHRMHLETEPAVVDTIAARCNEVETGARNVDHILSGTLIPRISTEILQRMSAGPLPGKLKISVDPRGEFGYTFPNDSAPVDKKGKEGGHDKDLGGHAARDRSAG
ncbi:MAG TPA: type VI secretion system ATPase TssH [Planctomycetota bacterium]|nr:type VI secretion system ATPase TssH [Planctomycetota bacterium]